MAGRYANQKRNFRRNRARKRSGDPYLRRNRDRFPHQSENEEEKSEREPEAEHTSDHTPETLMAERASLMALRAQTVYRNLCDTLPHVTRFARCTGEVVTANSAMEQIDVKMEQAKPTPILNLT